MDCFVKEKLQDWNLEEFSSNFESEGIDEDSFKLIDADTLKILIPKAGPRLKFKSYLDSFLKSCNPSGPTKDQENDSTLLNVSVSSPHSVDIDSSASCETETSSSCDVEKSQSDVNQSKKQLDIKYLVRRKLPEIFKKLETDPDQINILHKLKMNRLIVDTYIEKFGCKPSTKEKIDLAISIITSFPVLKSAKGDGYEQWFCAGNQGTASSGFIEQRFRNHRQRKLSSIEKKELGIGCKKQISINTIIVSGKEDSSVDFRQKKQWLIENDQPLDKVLQFMQDTFQGRRFEITKGFEGDIITEWPRILIPQVIDAEFTSIYGERKSDSLCMEFGIIASNIILQARHCGRKSAEDIVKRIDFDISNSSSSVEKICCAIFLLPFLLPQGVIVRKNGCKKQRIRPTSTQSLDHFIQYIPIGQGIEKFMLDDRLLGGERKQPFVLAIGEQFNPVQTFVIIESHVVQTASLLKAVDACFKVTYALNLEFSQYCQNVWHFLNEVFYKCPFNAEVPSCVLELKNRLFVNV